MTLINPSQTILLKFILNINKFASNHAITAELGKFPVHIYTDLKLVKSVA